MGEKIYICVCVCVCVLIAWYKTGNVGNQESERSLFTVTSKGSVNEARRLCTALIRAPVDGK